MTITQESRPGGQTEAARDTRSTHPQDTRPGSPTPIPTLIDVATLDTREAAVTGALIHASHADVITTLDTITPADVTSAPLRAVLRTIGLLARRGDAVAVTALGGAAQAAGIIRPVDRQRFDTLVIDLAGVDACPRGAGDLVLVPELIEATTRRRAIEHATRIRQAVDEGPADGLVLVLRDAARALEDDAARLDAQGVTA